MCEVVIVDAVRSPFGKRNGGLSHAHSTDVLGQVLRAVVERSQLDPAEVEQVVAGCGGQVGMQSYDIARTAWLAEGLPVTTGASTVDSYCGSSQQATSLAHGLVSSGTVDVAIAAGVELMSQVPMGAAVPSEPAVGTPITRKYWQHHEYTTQFEAAERLADSWGLTRADCDAFGKESQDRACRAQRDGVFSTQLVPVSVPSDPSVDTEISTIERDEGPRATTLEGLAALKPTRRPDGVHTAGTSSQISDGASALLLMTRRRAAALGLSPLATIVDACLVGTNPTMMLTGPITATTKLLERNGLTLDYVDVIEINEAFASVVLVWERELKPDMARVNPNGGAIALGHPIGATGAALIAKAVHELVRSDGEHALVTMCCGGGLGTGTLLRRS